jgi:hypothetical protein
MKKKSREESATIAIEVNPKCPRLAYRGMNAPPERAVTVQSQIVEVVDPSQMTVFDGGHLEYAHVGRDGGIPCDGNGEPLLEPKPGGEHQYTKRAVELLSKNRRKNSA